MRYAPFVLALLTATACPGDTVYLKDGRTLEGDVKKSADGWVVQVGGESVAVLAEDVKSINVGTSATNSDDAGLASLRRSVATLSDPKQAIEKYTRFIATAKGAPADAARADLLVWQDRADRALVRFSGAWVTPQEADASKAEFAGQLTEARNVLMDGRTKEAKAIVEKVLAGDAQDAAALYLRGVMAFGEGDVPLARKSFDGVVATMPGHAASLNNLAVVMMRQNQAPAALQAYVRAMQASPTDRRVMDNVAEALTASAEDPKLATAVKKTAAIFTPLDVALAGQLAQAGYFRWGATWVTQAELERLQAAEKQVNEQLQDYERDFKAVQDNIVRIDDDIRANNRAMDRIAANSLFRDETGRMVRTAYPQSYYNLQRDNEDLAAQRLKEEARLGQLRSDAKAIRAKLPTPRYTGAQKLIGPEGAPNLPPLPNRAAVPAPAPLAPTGATGAPADHGVQPVAPSTIPVRPPNAPPAAGTIPPPRAQTP